MLYGVLMGSIWASRGWTFQEHVLSRRMVVFLGSTVAHDLGKTSALRGRQQIYLFWGCQHSVWSINTPGPAVDNDLTVSLEERSESTVIRPDSTGSLDLASYLEVVCLYNGRDFTYPQDVLAACSGVLKRLERAIPGGFVSGLPRAFINESLVWQPFTKATRRGNVVKDGIAPFSHLSTWSWCGWKCFCDPNGFGAGFHHSPSKFRQMLTTSREIIAGVEWSAVSNDMMQEQSFSGQGLERQSRTNERNNLGAVDETSGIPRMPIQNTGERPCLESVRVRVRKAAEADMVTWPFISCITTRAHLRIRTLLHCDEAYLQTGLPVEDLEELSPDLLLPKQSVVDMPHLSGNPKPKHACSVLVLEDNKCQWAGVLRVMDDMHQPPDHDIELKAISQGEISLSELVESAFEESVDCLRLYRFPDLTELHWRAYGEHDWLDYEEGWKHLEDKRPADLVQAFRSKANRYDACEVSGICRYYNVLWVERQGGILYRRAAGRIKKEFWEQHCSEPIKIILS